MSRMIVPREVIEQKIFLIRGQKVMLDKDLAGLYGVEVKHLVRQVQRNIERFPKDFMFQLARQELANLRCQFGTSSSYLSTKQRVTNLRSQIATSRWGGRRYLPYAFTEHGILMLSSVLNSKKAVQVNIFIMRVFVKLREILSTHKELAHKLNELERKIESHDVEIASIFEAIRQLMEPPKERTKRIIGFHP